jgi:hypothetical protein
MTSKFTADQKATLTQNDEAAALVASVARDVVSLNYECPFQPSARACGSWCSLFTIAGHTRSKDGAEIYNVQLLCGSGKAAYLVKEGSAPGG